MGRHSCLESPPPFQGHLVERRQHWPVWEALPRCPALRRVQFLHLFPCSQLLDTPGLIPGFNLSELLGQEGGTANFSEMYRWVPAPAPHVWEGVQLLSALGCSPGWGQLALPALAAGRRPCQGRSKVRLAHAGEDMLLGGGGPRLPCFQPRAPLPQAVPARRCPVANAAPGPDRVPGRALEHQPGERGGARVWGPELGAQGWRCGGQ